MKHSNERRVIHWFRRDLRLADNLVLAQALASGASVIPIFILDPALLTKASAGAPRVKFMLKALDALDQSLAKHGSRLLIRRGDPRRVLPSLVRELNVGAVYAHVDYSPFARRRDRAVADALDVPLHLVEDLLLRAPGAVMKKDGDPYVVFTPFKTTWRSLPDAPRPQSMDGQARFWRPGTDGSWGVPSLADLDIPPTIDVPDASEARAQKMLVSFAERRIHHYDETRDYLMPDPFASKPPAGTSYLSPYVRFGLVSPRQMYWTARDAITTTNSRQAQRSINAWIDELIWREFYVHILYHFPHVARRNFRATYDSLEWRDAPADLAAWREGRTGYPVVDAAMRQLLATGWMPNRARMVVASFLTKDLLIHWQEGEKHFMQWLLDGDLAANNGGWQWSAGTGTDAQPYFRVFHPVSQSKKHDPDGHYIRFWVPELRHVPDRFIHQPWKMDTPPADYPPPMVDHSQARRRTLEAFKGAKA